MATVIAYKVVCIAALLGLCVLTIVTAREFDEEETKLRAWLDKYNLTIDVIGDCKLCELIVSKDGETGLRNTSNVVKVTWEDVEHHESVIARNICPLVHSHSSSTVVSVKSTESAMHKHSEQLEALAGKLVHEVNRVINATGSGLQNLAEEIVVKLHLEAVQMLIRLQRSLASDLGSLYENRSEAVDDHCRQFDLTEPRKNVTAFALEQLVPMLEAFKRVEDRVEQHVAVWRQRVTEQDKRNVTGVTTLTAQLDGLQVQLLSELTQLKVMASSFRGEMKTRWNEFTEQHPELHRTLLKHVLKTLANDLPATIEDMMHFLLHRVTVLHRVTKD